MAEELSPSTTIRFRCSFGGNILPTNGKLHYLGGETRIGLLDRSISFSTLIHKLTTLSGTNNTTTTVKYHLPNKGLQELISLKTDEEVVYMIEEFERFERFQYPSSICLPFFLFSKEDNKDDEEEDSRSSIMSSLLKGSAMRENWFRDALNCVVEGGCSNYASEVDHHQPLLNDNDLNSLISELNLYEGGQVEGSSISAQPVVAYQSHLPSGDSGSDLPISERWWIRVWDGNISLR